MASRKKPIPTIHVEPSSPAHSLDQYRQQMAGITSALNQGGLPSLLPVEMARASDPQVSTRTTTSAITPPAASSPTERVLLSSSVPSLLSSKVNPQQESSQRVGSPPTTVVNTTVALSSAVHASPPTPTTTTTAQQAASPTRSAVLSQEDTADIDAEMDPVALRHLLYDARLQRRRDKSTIEHQQSTIRELALKLNNVAEFIDMQEDLEDRLRGMKQQHLQQMTEQKEMTRVAHLEMLESRVKLRSVEEELKRQHDADITARATELLDARTAQVNEENFELLADRVMLSKDATSSKAISAKLAEENTRLRREAQLTQSSEKELLARSARQKKEITDLKRQFKAMEDNLDRVAADYEAQLAAQRKTLMKQLDTVTTERDAAQRDALRLHTELSKLRTLASQMMEQRSELELFFHGALADVKKEIVAERRQLIANSGPGPNGTQTNSSTLRIEGQPRLVLGQDSATRDTRQWTVDKRGFPLLVDPAKVTGKALPPIPASQSSTTKLLPTGSVQDVVPWEWDGAAEFAQADDADGDVVFYNEATTGAAGLRSIPDAPTLRELKNVKIESLSWREKERVLQSLFRRLQRSRPTPSRNTTASTGDGAYKADAPATRETQRSPDLPDDSDTFLTQQ